MPVATATLFHAMRRRIAGGISCVNVANIGVTPGGSITTKKVTRAARNTSSMRALLAVPATECQHRAQDAVGGQVVETRRRADVGDSRIGCPRAGACRPGLGTTAGECADA